MTHPTSPPLPGLPRWPQNSRQTAEETLAACSRLCLECGLCCTGAYLSWAPLTDDEIAAYSDMSIRPYRQPKSDDDEDPLRMMLPCNCHVAGRCSIFPNRPDVCGSYRCDLLKAMMNGSIDGEQARQITSHIKSQFEWLKSAAEELGYFSLTRQSLDLVLRDFYRKALPRAKVAPLHPHEAQFATNAFQYLQNIDRHLAHTKYLPRIGDIVGVLDTPKPGFESSGHDVRRFTFGAGGHVLELRNCQELVEPLRQIIKGWSISEINVADDLGPHILRVWKSGNRYYWDLPFPGPKGGFDEPLVEPIDVLHDIHYYIDDFFALEGPSHFFLHSAAVEIGGKLILLLGTHETGKTTLSMALANRGHRLLADDRIAIDPETGHAVAMGSVPLLRKPLPADQGFWPAKALVKKHLGPQDDSFAYVDLPGDLFAPKGYSAPVSAVVTLERSTSPTATCRRPIKKADVLKALASQYYCKSLSASVAFDGMTKIAENSQAHSLKYAKTKKAVEAIEGLLADSGGGTL